MSSYKATFFSGILTTCFESFYTRCIHASLIAALWLLSGTFLMVSAQVQFVPLESNPVLQAKYVKERMAIESKSGSRSGSEFLELNMRTNSELLVCVDTFLRTGNPLSSIEDLLCEDLQYINYLPEDNCLRITSSNLSGMETDLICLRLCDEEEECVELTLQVNVRRPRSLPFMDDFSYPGPYPDKLKWLDRHVFINNTMAENPVSIGVATFDGLNEYGSPYGGDEREVADVLTSTYFDLSSYTINDNIYLSFWIQPKGLGLRPRAEDVFRLEFLNRDGQWVEIVEYPGITGGGDAPPFEYKSILLTNAYLHEAFQFRFLNENTRAGIREIWHLDYIRMDRGRNLQPYTEDIAFTHPPSSIIYPYTSMPMRHYRGREDKYLNDRVGIGLFNHFEDTRLADPSWMILQDVYSGDFILQESDLTLMEVPPVVPVNQRNLPPGRHLFDNPMRSVTWLDRLRNASVGRDSLDLKLTYTLRQDQETANNVPETLRNNRVTGHSVIKDYFAYDDGTAEIGISLISNPGILSQLVVKFTTEEPDSLRGVQFHFPHLNGDASNLLFNIKVWVGELKEEEDFIMIFQRPIHVDQLFDSLQGFATYPLLDINTNQRTSIFIPPGDFYIGWQQVSTGRDIVVGYDRNNPQGLDYIHFNAGQGWRKLSESPGAPAGAVMMRPILGNRQVPSTSVRDREITNLQIFDLYPNPSDGLIFLKPHSPLPSGKCRVDIYNILGQLIQSGAYHEEIYLHNQQPGLYRLIVKNEQNLPISHHNFLLR